MRFGRVSRPCFPLSNGRAPPGGRKGGESSGKWDTCQGGSIKLFVGTWLGGYILRSNRRVPGNTLGAWTLRRIASPWKLAFLAGSVVITQFSYWAYGVLLTGPVQAAPDDGKAKYVDANVCASCHRQVAEDYRRTGMGRSFFRPAP